MGTLIFSHSGQSGSSLRVPHRSATASGQLAVRETELDFNLDIAPSFFPLVEPDKRQYWTTSGSWGCKASDRGPYRIFPTPAEAVRWAESKEARAINYYWDRAGAIPTTIDERIREARNIGRPGVVVMTYDLESNCWVVTRYIRV